MRKIEFMEFHRTGTRCCIETSEGLCTIQISPPHMQHPHSLLHDKFDKIHTFLTIHDIILVIIDCDIAYPNVVLPSGRMSDQEESHMGMCDHTNTQFDNWGEDIQMEHLRRKRSTNRDWSERIWENALRMKEMKERTLEIVWEKAI